MTQVLAVVNQIKDRQTREEVDATMSSILPIDKCHQQGSASMRDLLQCLQEIASRGPTFVRLLESSLDERCINGSDIDLLGTTTAVESLLATCFSWAQSGRCHFRVKRKREGNVSLVLFSRCGQFRIQFDLFTELWQLNRGRCGLRFEDVVHLLPPGQLGFVRLPIPVEAAIYLHKYVLKRRSISLDRIRQRLISYSVACRRAGATKFAAALDVVLQNGRVESAALTRAIQLLRSYNVVPSLTNSWQVVRQRWIARWRRWWPRSLVSLVDLEWNPAAHERQSSQANDNGAVFTVANQGVFKEHRLAGWLHSLGQLFVLTQGFRTWVYGREILAAGIPTPRPLAMIEERWGLLRFRSFVLTEFVTGTHLDDFVQENSLLPPLTRSACGQIPRDLALGGRPSFVAWRSTSWKRSGDLGSATAIHRSRSHESLVVPPTLSATTKKDWFQFVRTRPRHHSDAWEEFLATVTRREPRMVVTSPEDHS